MIQNFICNDLNTTDEPKESLPVNIIVNNEFNCDTYIVENTDDSNGNRNDDSIGNITLSNCFRPININETFTIETTYNTTTNNGNLDSKMNNVNNIVLRLKDLIDQSQKLPRNF